MLLFYPYSTFVKKAGIGLRMGSGSRVESQGEDGRDEVDPDNIGSNDEALNESIILTG